MATFSALISLAASPSPAWSAGVGKHPATATLAGARALARFGPDGRAAVAFASRTAPHIRPGHASLPGDQAGGSSWSAIVDALAGSGGGMGFALPLLLLASLAGALGLVAWRIGQRKAE